MRSMTLWGLVATLFAAQASLGQDSLNVRQLSRYRTWDLANDVVVAGNYAYVAAGNSGLRIVSIQDQNDLHEVGYYELSNAQGVAVAGDYAYVAAGATGLSIFNVSNSAAPVLAAIML